MAAQLAPGDIYDEEFEILGVLGQGRTSVVYMAEHTHSRREVALKILTAAEFANEADATEFRERFIREAKAAASLQHVNVVSYFSSGVVDDRPYLALEYVDGHDLRTELERNGPMDPARVLKLFVPCLEALGLAHKRSIVHRDLRPENLFLRTPGTDKERLVILDFGVALLDDGDTQKKLTKPGQMLGTPAYSSPEALRADLSPPARDVYAMGLLLVEALTGKQVVNGEDMYAIMGVHARGDVELPTWVLNPSLGPVLKYSLAPNYQQRFGDALAMSRALGTVSPEALVSGDETPVLLREYQPPEDDDLELEVEESDPVPPMRPPRQVASRRKNKGMDVSTIVIILVVALLVGVVITLLVVG